MPDFRSDAITVEGGLTRLVGHCQGAFRSDGGPCLCDQEGCFALVMPCCPCPGTLAYVRTGPMLEAVWPLEERLAGRVATTHTDTADGPCWRYIATVSQLPPGFVAELPVEIFTGTAGSCADGDCDTTLCTEGEGFVIDKMMPCDYPGSTLVAQCVLTATIEHHARGQSSLHTSRFGARNHVARASSDRTLWHDFHAGQAGSQYLVASSRDGAASGESWYADDPGNRTVWDRSEHYGLDDEVGTLIFLQSLGTESVCAHFINTAPPTDPECDDLGLSNPIGGRTGYCIDPVVTRVSEGTEHTVVTTSVVTYQKTGMGASIRAFDQERVTRNDTGETVSIKRRRRYRSWSVTQMTLSSGVTIEGIEPTPECETGNTVVLAMACDGSGATIAVDLNDLPDLTHAWTCYDDEGVQYAPTDQETEGPGVDVFWSLDPCQGPAVMYAVAVHCTDPDDRISFDPQAVAPGSVTLLWQGQRYSMTGLTTTDAPVAAVGSPDPCPPPPGGLCDGLVPNDIRCNDPLYRNCPQCAGFDIGDPDPRPTNLGQGGGGDPRVAAQLARQQQAYTGQYPGRCPSCGG